MRIRFAKMHGAGNDFVVLDAIRQPLAVTGDLARRLADRNFGIGADQVLVVEAPDAAERAAGIDFRYRIFNADGSEVEQCGNGARCFARFVREEGLTAADEIRVSTLGGVIAPRLEADGRVTVDMGVPRFEPGQLPFDPTGLAPVPEGTDMLWPIELGEARRAVSIVSMGNPHAVQLVDDVDTAPVATEGPAIERHARFPRRVNVGFLQPVSRERARLRVFERGAGETLACGTGACAAAVAGMRRGVFGPRVDIETRGGLLTIRWDGGSVLMTGPAERVFDGEIDLGAA